jgi:putative ABC transport system substrate-binding protein
MGSLGVSTAGLVLLGGCGPFPGQAPLKVPLIGYLSGNTADNPSQQTAISALRDGLREQGLIEGRDLVIEFRFADGQRERLPALVAELIRIGVRVIVTNGPTSTSAARQLTDRVPIVMFAVGDPVAAGWVASLARPGGNITGTASVGLVAKRVELLAAVVPAARRLANLTNLSSAGAEMDRDEVAAAAERLGMQVLVLDARTPGDIEPPFERATTWGADAVLVWNTAPFSAPTRAPVLGHLARSRLPAISTNRAWVEGALLMMFEDDERQRGRRTAPYVARILKGADPAEMPIDRGTDFELTVNRTTLANLGLTMPPDVAAQVTEWLA